MAALNALMIIFAFIGFTLLQVGTCQPKNSSSIIISNVISFVVSCLMFWATGYAFAFGPSANVFISHSRFFLIDATSAELDSWFYQFALLSVYIAISNGGFAERLRFWLYPFLAIFLSGFLYPVSTHWSWHAEGWLKKGINNTDNRLIDYQDAAGAGVIHMAAGAIAVVAAVILGARPERKDPIIGGGFREIRGETNTNIFLGGLLVLYGLSARNILQYSDAGQQSLSAVNTLLSACTSALFAFFLKRSEFCGENWNTKTIINAAITGIIGVSAAPGSMHPYGGFTVGFVAACAYVAWNVLLRWCHVDDISDTIAVNIGGGILALLAGPLFNKSTGVFYSGKIDTFQVFGWNLLGCLVIFAWHAICTALLLAPFACTKKVSYRIHSDAHEKGLDIYEHDEPAYPSTDTLPKPKKESSNKPAIVSDITSFTYYGKPMRANINTGFAESTLDQ